MGDGQFEIRPLRLSELLDEGLELSKQTFFQVLPFQLLLYLPSTFFLAYLFVIVGDALTTQLEGGPDAWLNLAITGSALTAGMMLMQVLLGTVASVIVIRGMEQRYRGVRLGFGGLARWGLSAAGRAMLLGILLAVLFSAVTVIPMVVLVAPAAWWGANGGGMTAGVMGVVGGLLAVSVIVAALTYFMIRYGLAGACLAVEGVSATRAMSRSTELVRGHFGRALGLLMVLFAIQFLVGAVLSAMVPTPPLDGIDPDELQRVIPEFVNSQILGTAVSQIAGMITGVYAAACWLLFYFTLRCEKEGFDLEHKVEFPEAAVE